MRTRKLRARLQRASTPLRGTSDQAGLSARHSRGADLALAGERLGQRERERERRVSDADASYYGPVNDTRTLNRAIPQRNHAKYNSLSKSDPVPLPRALLKPVKRQTTESNPKPDLMSTRHPLLDIESLGGYTRELISCQPCARESGEPSRRGRFPSSDNCMITRTCHRRNLRDLVYQSRGTLQGCPPPSHASRSRSMPSWLLH